LASSNPYGVFNFIVKISGYASAAFAECALPSASIEVMEYRDGNDLMDNVHKLPGLVRYGNLVLKRGLTTSMDLWNWFSSFATGTGTMQTVTVTLLDGGKTPIMKWEFTNAWPVKYESPILDGKKSALAIETLEIAVDGMQVANVPSQTT
jgi:phage tail-like protein